MELVVQEGLWNITPLRTDFEGSPFKECDDIILRFQEQLPPVVGDHECSNTVYMFMLPAIREMVFDLMHRVNGTRLGRVLVSRLAPHGTIYPHEDEYNHAMYYDRYHIVLQGKPGSTFKCGDEQVDMLTGEIWWFENALLHSVHNESDDDRIHVVVDIRLEK